MVGLADALFGIADQRVLSVLFGQPERSFFATEIISLARSGRGAVQRVLARLEKSGIATVRRIGTQKHYQANPESPIFAELRSIVRKTFGLAEPLRAALTPFLREIVVAFVFGSVAKRSDTAVSDIDLMIVGDEISYPEIYAVLESLGNDLGRKINPTIYSKASFLDGLRRENSFLNRVMRQPKIWIVGSDDAFAA